MEKIIPILQKTASWIVTLLVPLALILTAVRLLLTPVWIQLEYRTPNFPEDPFGFTLEDRLKWSIISLDYLLGNETLEDIEGYRLDDGAPMYNERELRHLVDSGNLVQMFLRIWLISLTIIAVIGVAARVWGFMELFLRGLIRGGWLTLGLVAAVLLFVVFAFGLFFTTFHEILFPPGTWTFLFSDTFIRLFPQRFWQDAFIWVGVITVLETLWLISIARVKPTS